jgi:hypothetical protein
MNDKCASGTGATIDKCMIKVGLPAELVRELHFDDSKLHHVAAKCGVFAETDIVNLVKSGIPRDRGPLLAWPTRSSLQNLSVLTRGSTLKHKVLLLGGPNTYLPFLQECWRLRIPQSWRSACYESSRGPADRGDRLRPRQRPVHTARSARASTASEERGRCGLYAGKAGLVEYMTNGRKARLGESAARRSVKSTSEVDEFKKLYSIPKFTPMKIERARTVRAVIGLDGGSTSSKAVLIDEDGEHRLQGLPALEGQPDPGRQGAPRAAPSLRREPGREARVLGFGATGYAADVLQECMRADVNIVETVAHMMSAGEVLRRRRRHLRHRRAGHQGPVHEERRHRELPALELVLGRQRHAPPGDGRSVRPEGDRVRRHRVRRRARARSSATAAPSSSTPTA